MAVLDMPVPVGADDVEHAAVVGDQQVVAVPIVESRADSSCSMAGRSVVGRFVEDEDVDAASL